MSIYFVQLRIASDAVQSLALQDDVEGEEGRRGVFQELVR